MTGGGTPPGGAWSQLTGAGGAHPASAGDTAELPIVDTHHRPPRRSLIGRFTVSIAGLLAAGCLVLGVGLVVLMLVVPRTGGTGLDVATGPGWPRTCWHLGVGAVGELALQLTRGRSWPARVTVATLVIVGVLSVLALAWWS